MKDVVLYEGVPTEFVSSFLELFLFSTNFQTSRMESVRL
jgi:hypothetical protein